MALRRGVIRPWWSWNDLVQLAAISQLILENYPRSLDLEVDPSVKDHAQGGGGGGGGKILSMIPLSTRVLLEGHSTSHDIIITSSTSFPVVKLWFNVDVMEMTVLTSEKHVKSGYMHVGVREARQDHP